MSETDSLIAQVDRYSARNYHPLPIVLSKGEGVWVWDVEGKKYLDCLSAYSALNQGHRHPKIIAALREQAERITLTSRAFHNDQMGRFLEKLCELSKMERALPMNSGVEAVETAIKASRKWGYTKKKIPDNQAEIIVCNGNFHGRTTTVCGFSSEPEYREGFGPATPGFQHIDFGNLDQLKSAIGSNTAAFLVEPIQGEAGILIPPDGFLSEAQKICREANVLFLLDEIQSGLGRTGKFFAYEHEEGVKPDGLIVGKALGGGVYPVSAFLTSAEVMGVFNPGEHGSTFGGNPLACAIALTSLNVLIDEKLVDRSFELGQYLNQELKAIQSSHVESIRCRGLWAGIEIKKSSGPARPFCEKLMDLGVLAKETHEQVIRLAPPLTIEKKDLDWMLAQIKSVL